ncbi:MAG: alpha/beta fold hydrolase [Burkholderiales bacterium]
MEAFLQRPDGCKLFYIIDDFTDAWRAVPTVLFVHGLAESTEAWRAWVPHFARRYRVVRVDLRGFGRSTPMPDEFEWSIDVLVDDLVALIHHLEVERVHLVGAKSGGSMTLKLAAGHPALVQTLTGVTPPVVGPAGAREWREFIPKHGMREWARMTMQGRLGSNVSQAEMNWWVDNIQSKTPVSTMMGYLRWVTGMDIRADVSKISCPTLIINTTGSSMRAVDSYKEWQPRIRNSQLVTIEGDAWHAAGAYPDRCAEETLKFVDGHASDA